MEFPQVLASDYNYGIVFIHLDPGPPWVNAKIAPPPYSLTCILEKLLGPRLLNLLLNPLLFTRNTSFSSFSTYIGKRPVIITTDLELIKLVTVKDSEYFINRPVSCLHYYFILTVNQYIYILLHDWEGNMGEYSVRGWQYWPERSEGQYRSRELNILPYCPTQRSAVIDLLYDLHTVLLVVHAQGSSL